jgi:predicted DNA-binding protein
MPAIEIKLPTDLSDAMGYLREASGVSDEEIVKNALECYIADQRQRDTFEPFFH